MLLRTIALASCLASSPVWADPGPRLVLATLGPQDAQCNYERMVFEVGAGELVMLAIDVPPGVAILGWLCSGTRCTREVRTWTGFREILEVDNGDPERTGGMIGDVETVLPAEPGVPTPCCSCPCDFAETCD
jgi:hypothetical protein